MADPNSPHAASVNTAKVVPTSPNEDPEQTASWAAGETEPDLGLKECKTGSIAAISKINPTHPPRPLPLGGGVCDGRSANAGLEDRSELVGLEGCPADEEAVDVGHRKQAGGRGGGDGPAVLDADGRGGLGAEEALDDTANM